VEESVVDNLLGFPHKWVDFAQDLLALYSAVLEVEVVGESRVPNVAEAIRVSVVEEADVGELSNFVFVDSESVGKPFSATEVASVFLCDILLPV